MPRHEIASTISPPASGPMAAPIPESDAHRPMARPRSDGSNDAVRIARLLGTSSAPPMPWMPRATSNSNRVGASPHSIEPVVNTIKPSRSARRRPKMSPNEPPSRMNAVSVKTYASTTQATDESSARKSRCRVGRATFTTVESRKLIDEERIVANRTHLPSREPIRSGCAGRVDTGRG